MTSLERTALGSMLAAQNWLMTAILSLYVFCSVSKLAMRDATLPKMEA